MVTFAPYFIKCDLTNPATIADVAGKIHSIHFLLFCNLSFI